MGRKTGQDAEKPAKRKKKGGRRPGGGLSEFVKRQIPEGSVIDFIFYDDFNGDGEKEAAIGYTQFTPFPPESSVIYVTRAENGFETICLITDESEFDFQNYGIYDCAAAADTDGDGRPELVITLAAGNGHYTTIFVFDWKDGRPVLAWHSEDSFYHGSVEVCDPDEDEIWEIVVESGTLRGSDILALSESCYHVREGSIYKWDGNTYVKGPFQVRMPYPSYNTAVDFISGLWRQEYKKVYDMAVFPSFLGLEGLDDSSPAAFKRYVERNIRPVLQRNLSKGKLEPAEPFDAYCLFSGPEDDLTVEIIRDRGTMKVQCLSIYKKVQPEQ